jgi:tetratricopeptide (TPR) repeat protein
LLAKVRLAYERRPVTGSYYGDAGLDGILEEYRRLVDGTALAYPTAGLRCLDFLRRLPEHADAPGGLLLLSADKGYHSPEDLQGRREPGFEVHGSFSMGVNYHALGQYFARHGGQALFVSHRHFYLDTCGFVLGEPAQGYAQTRAAFEEAMAEFGPEDFYLLQGLLNRDHTPLTAEQCLALLRLSRWDPKIFQSCFPDLLESTPSASLAVKEELREGTDRLWDNHYPIGEQYDLPYDLGVLLYKLNDYPRALGYFERSLALHGREAKALYNISLCHYCLRNLEPALRSATQAALLDPDFEPARAMVRRLQTDLNVSS